MHINLPFTLQLFISDFTFFNIKRISLKVENSGKTDQGENGGLFLNVRQSTNF